MCAELLPERVTLDDWGYPIVDGAPIPQELRAVALRLERGRRLAAPPR
jgi:ferredoxin